MKNEALIAALIEEGGGEKLAFLSSLQLPEVAQILCGFLNSQGGILLIGVAEDGQVVGLEDPEMQEAQLSSFLNGAIVPDAPVTVYREQLAHQQILLAKVWSGAKPPYVCNGSIWCRQGKKTVKASPGSIAQLIYRRQKNELHWERSPALGVTLQDLDETEINNCFKDLSVAGRGKIFYPGQTLEFLSYYGLYLNGNVTNAAVVLFGKEPARWLPQCRTRLSVLPNDKASSHFAYDLLLEGNLFKNMEAITQFFDVNIATSSHFNAGNWQRSDLPFPKAALREGLMNALLHRDYENVSGTAIAVFYADHLEISNHGELPGELTPADLEKNHLSLPRNPCLAHICFLRGWIEKIGRGTIKIIEECEQKGFPKPEWQSEGGTTRLLFPGVTVTAKGMAGQNYPLTALLHDAVEEAVKAGQMLGLASEVQGSLLTILQWMDARAEGASLATLMSITGKSSATTKRYTRILAKLGLMRFCGPAKTGRYRLILKT